MRESTSDPDDDQLVRDLLKRAAAAVLMGIGASRSAQPLLAEVDTEEFHCALFVFRRFEAPMNARVAPNLTHRELEIVAMIAHGQPNKAIARRLGISPWTVTTHCRHIFAKLGVRTRAEMIASLTRIEAHASLPGRNRDATPLQTLSTVGGGSTEARTALLSSGASLP